VALTLGAVAAGCGGAPADEPSTSTPPPASTETSSTAAADLGIPPAPDDATTAAYIADLQAIDAEIVGDKDPRALVSRGRDQCRSVKDNPTDQAKLVDLTNKRFTAPGHSDGFGLDKATLILAAVRKHICPTY
jgi:hypothetical protein